VSNGLAAVIANDFARVSIFTACAFKLEVPEGWKKEMLIGGDWCGGRNELCQMALDEGHSHLWFMDDDHAFPPQIIQKLLEHDKAVVTPICLTRKHPFTPVQYTERNEQNDLQYLPIPLDQAATNGLVEIQAGGCAGMLIRRDVLESIESPWFEYTDRSEDIVFCEKAKAAGFELFADLSVRLGHVTTAVVWPAVDGDRWTTGLNVGDLALKVDTADNVVADKEPQPATETTWVWELRSVLTDEALALLLLPAGVPFNYQPKADAAPVLAQWYCDDRLGDGFRPVGDSFVYGKDSSELPQEA
jgi:hypothetical protein